jgi:hypothetical protein
LPNYIFTKIAEGKQQKVKIKSGTFGTSHVPAEKNLSNDKLKWGTN